MNLDRQDDQVFILAGPHVYEIGIDRKFSQKRGQGFRHQLSGLSQIVPDDPSYLHS